MKKIVLILFILILVSALVIAPAQDENKGKGDAIPELISADVDENIQEDDVGTGKGMQAKAGNVEQVKAMVQARQQEMKQEMQEMGQGQQNMYMNQNQVRLAVHALLAMEGLVGGIGKNVSEIARGFNNSIQSTIKAEEKIQTRGRIARFFMGGDHEAAGEMEQEVNRNRERIQELKQLKEQCECDEEVMNMFQEQIQNMEQEQNRLQGLAQAEKKSKGIFGWLFK